MLLWLAFALLTVAALAAVLAPLVRASKSRDGGEAGTVAVYRDQLDEIEAERVRGLVDDAEASAARIEVSRRLLASAAKTEGGQSGLGSAPPGRGLLPIGIAAVVPLLTLVVYLWQGSPSMPSFPFASQAQSPLAQAELATLIAKVEARLREQPDDGDGWDVIAPIYLKLGRFQEAANAFARAARLKGETVRRLGGYAEATVLAADGIVGDEARRAYQRILQIEPDRPEARFWLALAKEQDGKLDAALADYRALLAQASSDVSWRGMVEQRIAEATARLGVPQSQRPRGPSADDVAAASKLSPDDRMRMIAQMVDGLAERLKRDGNDLAGWQRLINAYSILGRERDARNALDEARKAFAANDQALAELAALAKTLGLGT